MRIFTTILITSAVMLALVTCTSRRTPKDGKAAGQSPTIGQIVFKSKPLQNAFDSLVNDIDSFPNPLGPTIFSVNFGRSSYHDTSVTFEVNAAIMNDLPPDIPSSRRVGVIKFEKGIVAVNYSCFTDMSYIVNEAVLDRDSYEKYLYYNQDKYMFLELPSIRDYRLFHRDSLQLLWKVKSKYERN